MAAAKKTAAKRSVKKPARKPAKKPAGGGGWNDANCPRLVCQGGGPRLPGKVEDQQAELGPLLELVGTWRQSRTPGWNIVALPQGRSFCLFVRPYFERIVVENNITSLVPNRGASDIQCIAAVRYHLDVNDNCDRSAMHAENGMFLLLHNTRDHTDSVARLANIPHGNATLSIGDWGRNRGGPKIADINALPISGKKTPLGYTDPYLEPVLDCDGKTRADINVVNPNETLRSQTPPGIISTTTFDFSTRNAGGIANIPFIEKNADTTLFESTFWVETDKQGVQWLQYTQTIWIEFLPNFDNPKKKIIWPHVDINTLVKT